MGSNIVSVVRNMGSPCPSGALPNGSRLSCGRLARRRKGVGRQSVPVRAQHSASLRAITARQLQALVRRLPGFDQTTTLAAAGVGIERAEPRLVRGPVE